MTSKRLFIISATRIFIIMWVRDHPIYIQPQMYDHVFEV